jgi:hypothetical protein
MDPREERGLDGAKHNTISLLGPCADSSDGLRDAILLASSVASRWRDEGLRPERKFATLERGSDASP